MAVAITVNGVTATHVRFRGSSLREVNGPSPNAGTLIFNASAPAGGEQIVVTNGADTIFAGQAQKVSLAYDGKPTNKRWDVSLIDETFLANQRRPFGTWVSVSATTIANAILALYAPDVDDSGVAASLPAISINFDGSEPFMTAFQRIATAIGGRARIDYGNVAHLSLTDDGVAPDDVDSAHPPLDKPPITFSTDLAPVRTRIYGKGYGVSLATDVLAAETLLPVADTVQFETGGGTIAAGTIAGGAQTQILSYSGKQGGGGGTLIGPGALPAVAPTLALAVGSGLSLGVYKYQFTYTTAAGESLPSPLGTITTVAEIAAGVIAARPAPSAAPAVALGAASGGVITPGNWQCKTTFVYTDGTESLPSAPSVTLTDPSGNQQFNFSNVVVGDARVASRNIYMCFASSGTPTWVSPFLAAQIANNSGTTVTRDIALFGAISNTSPPASPAGYAISASYIYVSDTTTYATSGSVRTGAQTFSYTGRSTSSGVGALTGCSSVSATSAVGDALFIQGPYQQVSVSAIAVGPGATTGRKVYRTAVGGSQAKLLTTIANNSTTTYTDSTADGSLGANVPTGDTSGLTQPSGQVNAGSTSLVTASAGGFPSAGWVSLPGSQVVRYTGITTNTLTGIPASGVGSIVTTVLYGSQALPTPTLIGVNGGSGTPVALAKGSTIAIWVQRNDTTAQAALAALEKRFNGTATDGIREDTLFDGRLGLAALTAACDARLAEFSTPIVAVNYATRDTKTRAGATVHIDMSTYGLAGDYTIQDVTISFDGRADEPTVLYQVKAASVAFTLSDLLRLVQLTTP